MARMRTDDPTASLQTWSLGEPARVWVGGHNVAGKQAVEATLATAVGLVRPVEGSIDVAFVVPQSADEALYFAGKLRARLAAGARVWIVYPRPGSTRENEFRIAIDDLVVPLFERGFTEIGRAAVNEEYASIGFCAESMI